MDEDDWRCLQCGRYYYTSRPSLLEDDTAWQRRPPGGIAGRNINALVQLRNLSNERWRNNNLAVIAHLDEGRTVPEIAAITGTPPRYIREVRARLAELG